jgi:iron complex outermembrane recepter protein
LQYKQAYGRALLACAFFIAAASAADAGDIGTITVTAERQPALIEESSRPVTIIDRKTIENSHAANLVDLLRGRPDIVVRDTSGIGAKSQIDLGGYGESAPANTLVLIDGRPVNSDDLSGVDWTQIPVDSIERIEIIHGGGSVLYGAGAVGGVINLITRVPQKGGTVSAAGGSYGSYRAEGRVGTEISGLRADVHASGRHSDGYRDNGGLDLFDAGGRAEYDATDSLQLYLRGNQHHDKSGQPGSLTATQMASNRQQTTTPNDVAKARDSYVEGGALFDWGNGVSLDLPTSWRKRTTDAEYSGFRVQSTLRTIMFRPKLRLNWNPGVKVNLVAGSDIERGRGTLSSFDYKRRHDGYYGLLTVSAPDKLWVISGGGRSESLRDSFVSGTTTSSQTQNKPSWEAGASLNISPLFGLHLSAASSTRFPLLDERFNYTTLTINPSLLPQTGRHYGVSVHSALKSLSLDASVSRADLKNEIFFNPATFNNENYTDNTRHDVLFAQLSWKAEAWAQLRANYTYTKASFRGGSYDGKTIPAVPAQRFGVALDSDWGHGFGSTVDMYYVGTSYLISDQANTSPRLSAYLVADLVARYRWRNVDTFLRIDNIGNRKYNRYGVHSAFSGDTYYPSPELSVMGGASYHF